MNLVKLLTDMTIKEETAKTIIAEVREEVENDLRKKIEDEVKAEFGVLDKKAKGIGKVRRIKSFEDWNKSEVYPTTFVRPDGSQVMFECRGLNHEEVDEIQKKCTVNPPKRPKRNPITNKVVHDEKGIVLNEDNIDDPKFKEDQQEMIKKEKLMTLEYGLTEIKIPGKEWKEKWNNLNKIVAGDIDRLYNYIVFDLSGYRGIIAPFVKGL